MIDDDKKRWTGKRRMWKRQIRMRLTKWNSNFSFVLKYIKVIVGLLLHFPTNSCLMDDGSLHTFTLVGILQLWKEFFLLLSDQHLFWSTIFAQFNDSSTEEVVQRKRTQPGMYSSRQWQDYKKYMVEIAAHTYYKIINSKKLQNCSSNMK